VNSTNLEIFWKELHALNVEAALLSNPATITWLTGYSAPIETGPSPFEGGPALAWCQDGEITLLLSDAEAPAALTAGVQTHNYLSYTIDQPLDGMGRQAEMVFAFLSEQSGKKWVGIELNFLPAPLKNAFDNALPDSNRRLLDGKFDSLRAVKTPEEIQKIRAALALSDLAQSVVRAQAEPGMTELELWGLIKAKMEVQAGTRVPVLVDLVSGLRSAEIGGLPTAKKLNRGDAVIADIVPRLDGYWGDNAGTHFIGEPPSELKRIYHIVRSALLYGIDAIRPGVQACEIDRLLRAEIEKSSYSVYPHHSGHGLGATFHEEPRLVPYNTMQLQPGMIVAVEPGIYVPGLGGVRLEDVVLVTEDGCEVLTTHLL
jgi:Xaa-Pro dipeptidase